MENLLLGYHEFFKNNLVFILIFWVLLIALARTKMEMKWLDIWIPLIAFLLWGISYLILTIYFYY